MLNTPTQSTEEKDALTECMIDLAQKEPCYSPGDVLAGKVNVKISHGILVIASLRVTMKGVGKIAVKSKKEEACVESCVYLKKEWNLVEAKTTISEPETSYAFQETLPFCLPTSVQSNKGSIIYSLMATLEYFNEASELCIVKAVRGFTVIEELDLNRAPRILLEERTEMEQRKFGWFTCTGGQMKLNLTLERTAFVCGEGVSVVGKMENKSDKIIDKVNVVLQRRLRLGTDLTTYNEETFMEVQDIHEDLLAMYVVPGSSVKIDKRIHIPPCAPSTPPMPFEKSGSRDEGGVFSLRRRSTFTRRQSSASLKVSNLNQPRRLISISYAYVVRVKAGGSDLMEISIPVTVGSKPWAATVTDGDPEDLEMNAFPGAIFKVCRSDKPITLLNEKVRTLCNKAQLQHLNQYPFYPDLKTSSKQSKKLCIVAGNLRSEARVLHAMIPQHPSADTRNEPTDLNVESLFRDK